MNEDELFAEVARMTGGSVETVRAIAEEYRSAHVAVSEKVREGFDHLARTEGYHMNAPTPAWATEVYDRFCRLMADLHGPRACPHVGLPVPTIVEAWNPEGAMCVECHMRRGDPQLSEVEELTCDNCGKVGDHIHWGMVNVGFVTIVSGLCCDCLAETNTTCSVRRRQEMKAVREQMRQAQRQADEHARAEVAEAVARALQASGAQRIELLHELRSTALKAGDSHWAQWAKRQLRKTR